MHNKKHIEILKKSQGHIEKVQDVVKNQPLRQKHHFMAPAGWINDPNGFSYCNGQYHLFYQHNPYDTKWGPMHWGHAVSDNLINWKHLPIALAPSEFYDDDKNGGCFSGSAIENNGEIVLMYTGAININDKPVQTQCIARSKDGVDFEKYENNPVIKSYPINDGDRDFRDPKIFKENDKFYCVIGSTHNDDGRALLYQSEDLLNWNYVGVLAQSNGKLGTMWECPDFFKLGNKYVLVFSPMGLGEVTTLYLLGDMDFETGKFTCDTMGQIDYGFDYYAPQSLDDNNGRRVVIAWQNSWPWMPWFNGFGPTDQEGWNGCMSIPREVKLSDDNKLKFVPVEEFKSLRKDTVEYKDIMIEENDINVEVGNGINYELEAEIDLKKTTSNKIEFILRASENRKTLITFDLENKKLSFDRNNSDGYSKGIKTCNIELKEDILNVRVISDTSSLEVYTDDYKTTMTSNIYPNSDDKGIKIVSVDGKVYINKLIGYSLA